LSRGGSAAFGDAAAAAPPDQVAQVAQAMAQNPGARGMDLAAKMMEKMGWKSGLGLGRNKQVRNASVANAVRVLRWNCVQAQLYILLRHIAAGCIFMKCQGRTCVMQGTALTCCAVLLVLAKCLMSWEREFGNVYVLLHSFLCNHQSACDYSFCI